jgi:general secretion pathway protein A
MYLDYYGLKADPFGTNPDPDFFWLGKKHKEALSFLKNGILKRDGFLSLTGPVGTGKTSLIRYFLKTIDSSALVATIHDPMMPVLDFYNILSEEFKLNKEFSSETDFLLDFRKFLLKAYSEHKTLLLILDEAQRLNHERLKQIHILSYREVYVQKLINIIFVGQNETETILMDPRNEAVGKRISTAHHLQLLDEDETKHYVVYRLKAAGAKRGIFTAGAGKSIFVISNGIPRLINSICDCALQVGMQRAIKLLIQNQ